MGIIGNVKEEIRLIRERDPDVYKRQGSSPIGPIYICGEIAQLARACLLYTSRCV